MRLQKAVEEYIEHKRSLGMIFRSQAVILRAFAKAQGDIDIQEVVPGTTRASSWTEMGRSHILGLANTAHSEGSIASP